MHPRCFAPRASGVVAIAATLATGNISLAAPIPVGVRADSQAVEWLTGGSSSTDSMADNGLSGPRLANALAAFSPGATSTTSSTNADYGFLQVITHTLGEYASTSGHLMNAQGISHASFRDDTVVVNAPGYGPGQFASFTAYFDISHLVDFDVDVNAVSGGRLDITGGFHLEVNIGNAHPGPYGGVPWTFSTVNGSSSPSIPTGLIPVPVSFEYGVPFTISADLEINLFTSLFGSIDADVNALMNLGSAFVWQGASTTGLPEGVTITSDHVDDWTVPYEFVPGPASVTLLPLAAGAALRRRRRR